MKCTKSVALFAVALLLASSVVGCRKKPQNVTPLPGSAMTTPRGGEDPGRALPPPGGGVSLPIDTAPRTQGNVIPVIPDTGLAPAGGDFSKYTEDRAPFADKTVYFDFDKSNLRSSETHKLDSVVEAMKTMTGKALRVEGHCDERGTEEYNRALGERRALAIREYLVMKGMNAAMIDTISYGENKPAELGHDEAAWSKNRRGELVVLIPPGQ